jgi:hypothetical protein
MKTDGCFINSYLLIYNIKYISWNNIYIYLRHYDQDVTLVFRAAMLPAGAYTEARAVQA